MRSLPVALLALAFVFGGAAGRDAGRGSGTPLPGYWRYDTSFLFSDKTEMRCITPADIDKVLQGPQNKHYDCTYPVRVVGGGKARFEGACVNRKKGDRAEVALKGTYSPTAFEFHGVVKPTLGGLPLPISASISAARVSETCPAA